MYQPMPRKYLTPEPCDDPLCPPGFYKMAGWEDTHAISKDGRIWSKINHKIMDMCSTLPKSKDRYKTFMSKYGLHQLLAETFLSKEHIPTWEKACVNHIDGNKHNNILENIEWTTVAGNSRHAKEMGLLKGLCKITIKNFYTGEEKSYLSISDMCYELSVSQTEWSKYMKSDRTKNLFLNKYLVIKGDEETYPDYEPTPAEKSDEDQGWMVIDRRRACLVLFTTAVDASLFMGHTVRYIYDLYRKSLAQGSHVIKSGDERYLCCPIKYHTEIMNDITKPTEYIKKLTKHSRPIRVKDLETNKFKFYDSLRDFAEELGVQEPAIALYLRKHKNKYKGKYKVKWLPKPKENRLCDIIGIRDKSSS